MDNQSQLLYAVEAMNAVKEVQRNTTNPALQSNYIIYGDFNMNPWEDVMVLPGGFNAQYSWAYVIQSAVDSERKINSIAHPYLYNASWLALAKANVKPKALQGTFEYGGVNSDPIYPAVRWNILDQFLLSKGMARLLSKPPEFKILPLPIEEPMNFKVHHPVSIILNFK